MKFIIIILFTLKAQQLISQSNSEKESGVWYMYNGSHILSENFSLKSMAHFRFFEIDGDLQQFIGRLGVNYKINKRLNATLGYAYLNTDTLFGIDGGTFNEHRIYEDLNVKHKMAKLELAHRFRAEQRFFNSQNGHFIRYQLELNYPISDVWSTYLYHEVFFDFDGELYNQNWLGAGVKYQLSKVIKLQLGYMNIGNANNQSFDRIQIGIAINTDYREEKKILRLKTGS